MTNIAKANEWFKLFEKLMDNYRVCDVDKDDIKKLLKSKYNFKGIRWKRFKDGLV